MPQSHEIEIKTLLGSKEKADELRSKILNKWPGIAKTSQFRQLNHYFVDGDFDFLRQKIKPHLSADLREKFEFILANGKSFSIRTRDTEGRVLLVIKTSIDNTTSANGIARMEFEAPVGNLSLSQLDELMLGCGFSYQSKWSREREEYKSPEISVCIDKNAGYGYLAEFEKVVDDPSRVDAALASINSLLSEFGLRELPQDRLERMFAHYNENWPQYYGTDKTFIVE